MKGPVRVKAPKGKSLSKGGQGVKDKPRKLKEKTKKREDKIQQHTDRSRSQQSKKGECMVAIY